MPRILVALLILLLVPREQREPEWAAPGGDPGARRFSAFTQITRENVSTLQQAWSFDTGATNLQGTPTVVGGLMYVTGGRSVFALEPETGKQVWRFDAQKRAGRRGVAYWPGADRVTPRVYVGVDDGRLMALDARTGEPIAGFGTAGSVDLKASIGGDGPFMLDSPPIVYRNILITGGSNTEGEPSTGLYGDIRGWDAQSGRLLWSFHTVPRAGEPGVETWEGESWKNRSGANAWTYLTLDPDRGLVFAATGSATSDFYGADRRGKNLYANSRDRARRLDRPSAMASTARAPRSLGLGSAGGAGADRGHARRPDDSGGRADDEDEPVVHLQSCDRRTAVRHGGAAGATEQRARRGRLADAAVSGQAGAARKDGVRSGDGHVLADARARGVLPRSLGQEPHVRRSDVHPVAAGRHDGDVPEHARRRQLERPVL